MTRVLRRFRRLARSRRDAGPRRDGPVRVAFA